MTKNLLIYLTLAVTSLYLGCTEGSRSEPDDRNMNRSFEIDISRLSEISMGELYSHIELIPLETSSKSIIKEISKLVLFESRYYILDSYQNAVCIFDSCGKFVSKIQNIGNGPGEYTLLTDFNINYLTKDIELLNPRGELLIYSIKGEFLRSIKIPIRSIHQFTNLSKDIILFYSLFEHYKLFYYSRTKDSVIKEDFEFPDVILKTPLISSKFSPFNKCDTLTTFFQGFSYEILSINNMNLTPKYKWDFGKNSLQVKDLLINKPNEYYPNFLRSSEYVHSFTYFIEDQKFIYTRFMYKRGWYTLIYNKNKSTYQIIKKFKEKTVPPAFPTIIDGGILTWVDPSQIQILITPTMIDEKFKKIYQNINLEDNPILIRYYYKL